jgi:DnaJ-class molecular chaperone
MHQQRTTGPSSRTSSATTEPDFYALLGVPETATVEQIKRAYRAAMKRIHPDRVKAEARAAAEEQAREINLAYRTLTDPTQRRQYDARRKAEAVQEEIMSRYFGGFGAPGSRNDLYDEIIAAARAEQRRKHREHDRGATTSLLIAFVGLLAVAVAALVAWGVASSIVERVF